MATIQEKLFTGGVNLGSPIFVQGGANGAYSVAANQIAWGDSTFNGKSFEGTTVGLLTAIEEACAGIDTEQVNQIVKNYLETNGSDVFATDVELNEGLTEYYDKTLSYISSNYITSSAAEKFIDTTELDSALAGKANTADIPTIRDTGNEQTNEAYYISNINVVSAGNNYEISYTFAALPSTEIVASNLWEDYDPVV